MAVISFLVQKTFQRGDDRRDAGLATPEDIRRFDDICYGTDRRWQMLDVYRPAKEEGKRLPVIVSVHGGGWVYGDKERYQYYCMSLAQQGFAVVNFTYRLAPKHKFPAPLADTNLVIRWILRHAGEYLLDTGNIFGVGDSAGAQILALYSCICTNPSYAARFAFRPPEGFKFRAVALNCGAYRIETKGEKLTAALMKDYLPKRGTKEELEAVMVLAHVTDAFPPALVMTSYGDFLKEQAPPLTDLLQEKGVPCESVFYGDAENPLGHVFHCNIRLPEAQACNEEECRFFRRNM